MAAAAARKWAARCGWAVVVVLGWAALLPSAFSGGGASPRSSRASLAPWLTLPPRTRSVARWDGSGEPLAPSAAVSELLAAIEGTERGVKATAEQKEQIFRLITQLEEAGEGRDYLEEGSVFGKYEVAYVGAPSSRVANPAGGRWRGGLGRLLCPTRGLYQHLLKIPADPSEGKDSGPSNADATAVNLLEVALLGLLPVAVVLHGPARRLSPSERAAVSSERATPGGLSANAVRANFEAPRLALGSRGRGLLGLARHIPPLRLRAGPRTSVVLDASYVDERVRIGKGASGIRFVFTRAEEDPNADIWQRVLAGRPFGARALGGTLLAAGAAGAARAAAVRGAGLAAAVAAGPWVLLALFGFLAMRSSGGIVEGQPRKADYPGQGMSPVED